MLNLEKQKGNDRFLVERFSQWIPGWNKRQLTLDDLGNICDDCGIAIVEMPLEDDGYAVWLEADPFVYINSQLPYSEQVITGFHELAHILYHPNTQDRLRLRRLANWNWSKCDRQAEIVGCVAWMPDALVCGLRAEEMTELFDVRRESAEFRAQLKLWNLR